MVSIRSMWQGTQGAWLIDTPPQMISLMTDSPQRNATVITIAWPSVSESVLRVRLRVTIFCILALPCVTLGITAKEVNTKKLTNSLQVALGFFCLYGSSLCSNVSQAFCSNTQFEVHSSKSLHSSAYVLVRIMYRPP